MIECDLDNSGCIGGWLTPSTLYIEEFGLVTEECMPYTGETAFCQYKCSNEGVEYDKYYCKDNSLKVYVN